MTRESLNRRLGRDGSGAFVRVELVKKAQSMATCKAQLSSACWAPCTVGQAAMGLKITGATGEAKLKVGRAARK